ncbi:Uncharacterised protein [Mycobacterium tuberculosis]|nr:Uncharacterised protein [Mycobacterium tuberculosis]COW84272.1 Uncharacterised protein [Mycobacterium tuberculosis]
MNTCPGTSPNGSLNVADIPPGAAKISWATAAAAWWAATRPSGRAGGSMGLAAHRPTCSLPPTTCSIRSLIVHSEQGVGPPSWSARTLARSAANAS